MQGPSKYSVAYFHTLGLVWALLSTLGELAELRALGLNDLQFVVLENSMAC